MAKKKVTEMSEVQVDTAAQTEAPARKRRKAQGPRKTKPIFLVIRYTDEAGNPVKLDKARLSIENTKNAEDVVELVTNGDPNATVFTIKVESEARPSPATEA